MSTEKYRKTTRNIAKVKKGTRKKVLKESRDRKISEEIRGRKL